MSEVDKEITAGDQEDSSDPESDDILSLLNGDPNENLENEDDDMEGLEPEDEDSPEVLKTKLHAKNKIIRQREKAIKRMQSELDEKGQGGSNLTAEDLAKAIQQGNNQSSEEEETEENSLEDLKEKFEDDPSSIIDILMQREQAFEQKLARVLQQRDDYFKKQYAPNGGQPDPEVKVLAERLKQRPEYAGFNEDQLLAVAKTLKPLKSRIGNPPASTTSKSLPMTASNSDVEKVSKSALEAMGYTDED